MKKIVIGMLALGTLVWSNQARADFISAISNYKGPIEFDLVGRTEQTNGETWGIFRIDLIRDQDSSILWTGNGNDIAYGIFYGVNDVQLLTNPYRLIQSGGFFTVYHDTDGTGIDFTIDPLIGRNGNTFTGMNGTVAFEGIFDPGIYKDNPNATIVQDFSPDNYPMSGSGTGYGSVTAGPLLGSLDSNYFVDFNGGTHDLLFTFDFTPGKNGWDFQINDPVFANAVPEPATMLLFGAGLAGLAGLRRRRNK